MDNLDLTLRSKIQIIVYKLQKLECTLLGNEDDGWIMELLFKPGFHRYHLIEWMLSKLRYDIRKMSGPQNSPEERLKNLQLAISSLGICRENSHNIIKGNAEVKEQLQFWYQLTDIIWLKHQNTEGASRQTDESFVLPLEKNKVKHKGFEDAMSCINNLCGSVNLKHLFKCNLDLLSPDVQREVGNFSPSKEIYKIPTLKEMEEKAKENPGVNLKEFHEKLLLEDSLQKSENDSILELNQLEERLAELCDDFKDCAESGFSDVYYDLRPLIHHAKTDAVSDVGPVFKNLEAPLDHLLQLKNSFAKLESSYSKLLTVNSDLESILNQDSFSDENYVNILNLVKGET